MLQTSINNVKILQRSAKYDINVIVNKVAQGSHAVLKVLKKYWISKLVFKTLKKYWILPKCTIGI